jgi:hypothetical protein
MPPLPRQGTIPLQFHYLESLSLAQGFSLTRAAQASLLQNLLLQVPGPPSYASSMLRNVYPPDCPVLSQSGTRSSPGQENPPHTRVPNRTCSNFPSPVLFSCMGCTSLYTPSPRIQLKRLDARARCNISSVFWSSTASLKIQRKSGFGSRWLRSANCINLYR